MASLDPQEAYSRLSLASELTLGYVCMDLLEFVNVAHKLMKLIEQAAELIVLASFHFF